jgi:hypothetical protein
VKLPASRGPGQERFGDAVSRTGSAEGVLRFDDGRGAQLVSDLEHEEPSPVAERERIRHRDGTAP